MNKNVPTRARVGVYTFTGGGMMAGVKPEEAKQFSEEDEDPARVFAVVDAAEKGRTAPPGGSSRTKVP